MFEMTPKMGEFADVEPLSISTGLPDELCEIMYTDEYRELLGIARSLMARGELSERALRLTGRVIDLAPAFYTIWNYRFDILVSLSKDLSNDEKVLRLNEELDWIDEFTLNNPKNYQIWSYKQCILQNHPSPVLKRELPILKFMLDEDTKNYHVWSFRKWCILFFNDFSNELEFADSMVERDVYNNSAWTHRMFILKNLKPTAVEIKTEVEYIMRKINYVPQNISPWTYLRGIYENFLASKYDNNIVEFAKKFTSNVTDLDFEDPNVKLPDIESSYSLEFLAHIYSLQKTTIINAKRAYMGLSSKYDPIRKFYWDSQISRLH
ncbi:hypothetical protein HG535_0H00250 [Zygotorulaspora mrakii]|uniref:Protein farnesyltransferase/geranylgeranyltransferase type-1 subunit alpha n=1 Tax=Zygotorulaspora mrakii TaxID=42260 RepID=A0A7H9B852_ZYGMR|nr:uncharacterized protein HG535_0H00250 [Zygotorulaspora mrakii]QLG74700.1 hypothetical protein HG535_0H00250 [Zygotorulaspora mrakii]